MGTKNLKWIKIIWSWMTGYMHNPTTATKHVLCLFAYFFNDLPQEFNYFPLLLYLKWRWRLGGDSVQVVANVDNFKWRFILNYYSSLYSSGSNSIALRYQFGFWNNLLCWVAAGVGIRSSRWGVKCACSGYGGSEIDLIHSSFKVRPHQLTQKLKKGQKPTADKNHKRDKKLLQFNGWNSWFGLSSLVIVF